MPLDTGDIAEGRVGSHADDQLAALRPVKVVLGESGHVGSALRIARERLGLAEDDIAQFTRVRAAYIAALEAFDFDVLPARPFVVGYVRAYAKALGLESEAVVARFHAEAPKVDGKLRAPGGVRHEAFGSIRWLLAVGAVVAAAVIVWNLARRAELRAAAPPRSPARVLAPAVPSAGPAVIGAPLPTPPEATTPPVYQTPGLATIDPAVAPPVSGGSPTVSGGPTDGSGAGAPFAPSGAVFGASAPGAGVILQARKATSLVVRGPGGAVYFASLLKPGEAWRAPGLLGLTVDVGAPSSVEVFVAGASRGRLAQSQTPVARLAQP